METRQRNAKLRLQRRLRGWRLADVADGLQAIADEPLGVDAQVVSRWERGARRPNPRYVRLLCRLFQLPADQLGLVDGPDDLGLPPPEEGGLSALDRRNFLAVSGAILGEITLNPLGPAPWEELSSAAAIEAAAEVIPRYRRLDGSVPSRELLGSVRAHLQLTLQLLGNADAQWARRRLAAAASEAASFAAWLLVDLNESGAAQQHYRIAIEVAQRTEDPLLVTYQLGSLAGLMTEIGNSVEALALCRAVQRQLPRSAPPAALAWLGCLRAIAHATGHQALDAQRSLEAADALATGADVDRVVWPWLTPFGVEKLAAARGRCELHLGRPLAAVEALNEALAAPSITIRRRGELLAELATAHARRREPEKACQALTEALSISSRRRSPFLLERVRSARGRLDAWHSLPAIAEFDERLYTTGL